MSSPMGAHNDSLEYEKQVSPLMLNFQESQFTNHGSPPSVSVIKSTPEAQKKILPNQLHAPFESENSSDGKELVPEELKLFNIVQHGQRGRMESQRCHLDPSKSAPTTPQNAQRKPLPNFGVETESFLSVLANSQSRRLDDQRVFLPILPGLEQNVSNSQSNPESNYLCYMVSKVQGSRMDDQRCSLPQIITSDALSIDLPTNGSERTRSASFCTNADILKSNKNSVKKAPNPVTQDGFFNMMSQAQQRRMEDQRCELKPTPKLSRKELACETITKDTETFFQQLATSQSNRLNDQRVSLPSLPGIQNGTNEYKNPVESEANYLCYMVSKVQGSRMDEQRCSAPFIFQNMSPSFQHKEFDKALQRSSSLNRTKTGTQEISELQKEQFLKMMKHAQKGRMEEQRCSLPCSTPATPTHNGSALNNMATGANTDAYFKSQARRVNKQHTDPLVQPSTSGASAEKPNAVNNEAPKTAPQITITQSTPKTSKKEFIRPMCLSQTEHFENSSIPKSASYGQELLPPKLTVRVSMSFSSLQGVFSPDQHSNFPELFLTLGAPGDHLVIPLSPVPGRRLSLSLNLIPKEETEVEHTSPNHSNPWMSHSRPPSPTVRVPSHSPSSSQDKSMLVPFTEPVTGQTSFVKKDNKEKSKGKDKPTQEKGKKTKKKDKSGHKH